MTNNCLYAFTWRNIVIGNIAILKRLFKVTKRELIKQIKDAEKKANEPKLNPEYKRGRRTHAEMYQGVKRNKYLNEWLD